MSSSAPEEVESMEIVHEKLEHLVHSCNCRLPKCPQVHCRRMKKVVAHAIKCEARRTGQCQLCRRLIALCSYHSQQCQRAVCRVPFCMNIRAAEKEKEDAVEENVIVDKSQEDVGTE
ncbi:unnamed protein product [Caenorhabditis sp. 36 PRJEB53466]|nr:unnamed protein product [Caenorhabditis sp. 36 PRJEB53466]